LALIQEAADIPNDTGRPVEVLRDEFSGRGKLTELEIGAEEGEGAAVEGRIAWEMVDPVFPRKEGIYKPNKERLGERARLARKWLWERNEEHVVAVLHGDFLHYMSEEWVGFCPILGTGWYNTEYRTYEFLPLSLEDENPQYSIREFEWSKLRRQQESEEALKSPEAEQVKAEDIRN